MIDEAVTKDQSGMRVIAFLGHQALGNFIECNLAAASYARSIEGAKLAVIYRDDRPYKRFIVEMNPMVSASLVVPADTNFLTPIDWFDGREDISGLPFSDSWIEQGFHKPDLFLTPSMLNLGKCIGSPPRLRIPEGMLGPLTDSLKRRGLDETNWFVCIHLRESQYAYRHNISTTRSVNPRTYLGMIDNIIRVKGGQVVRLGDPSMTPFPDVDGLIDLSQDPLSFPEQAFASSRARYYIGTDSGPTYFPQAFNVPMAQTNACGICLWNDGTVVLRKRVKLENGREVSRQELTEMGALTHGFWPIQLSAVPNEPEELIAVSNHMYEQTQDCIGWRHPAPDEISESGVSLNWPLPWRDLPEETDILFWGEE